MTKKKVMFIIFSDKLRDQIVNSTTYSSSPMSSSAPLPRGATQKSLRSVGDDAARLLALDAARLVNELVEDEEVACIAVLYLLLTSLLVSRFHNVL